MLDVLKSHTSVRQYTNEEITDETFYELLNAAQHAASSNFIQAYSVIEITDPKVKAELGKLSKNELQFETAARSLVFCADLKRVDLATAYQDTAIHTDSHENFIVSVVDTALFAQNFVVACESMGYGVCYIGGVRNNPEQISDLLNLPENVIPLFGMTVGVPEERNEVKPRMPVEAILHKNSYQEDKYSDIIRDYDQTLNTYYKKRMKNNKDTTWSEDMAAFLTTFRRPHMKAFLETKGFLKK